MHLLKIIFRVVVTLAAMRLVSWCFLWLLGWASKSDSLYLRLASNSMALFAFAAFLVVDRMPGELLDTQALAFGAIVFASFFGIDARWLPPCLLSRIQARRGPSDLVRPEGRHGD
jgi:hypothetical protein